MRKSENYNILGHNYDIRSLNKPVELLRKTKKTGIEKSKLCQKTKTKNGILRDKKKIK